MGSRRQAEDEFGRWASLEVGGVRQKMRWIEPGTFMMGSPEGEAGRDEEEGPRHEVTLKKGYWLGDTPCTQELWNVVMGSNPSLFQSPWRPVEQVNWKDCRAFLERLREAAGFFGRLPTEAEWEYACRAGTMTATWVGDLEILGDCHAPRLDPIAWYGGNSGVGFELENGVASSDWPEKQYEHKKAGTRLVKQKDANPYGLYDMLGHVFEWCEDSWDRSSGYPPGPRVDPVSQDGVYRVLRGGSWASVARNLRAASRIGSVPGDRDVSVGFRLAGGEE